VLLVVEANAIIDPWAVMVHPRNTPSTNGAMMALRGFNGHALFALLREILLDEPNLLFIYILINHLVSLVGNRVSRSVSLRRI